MTRTPKKPKVLGKLQELQKEHLEIVLTLTRANADLLQARQQASGIEIEVIALEKDLAERGNNASDDWVLSEIHSRDATAKQKLEAAEQRVEEIDQFLAAISLRIAEL